MHMYGGNYGLYGDHSLNKLQTINRRNLNTLPDPLRYSINMEIQHQIYIYIYRIYPVMQADRTLLAQWANFLPLNSQTS